MSQEKKSYRLLTTELDTVIAQLQEPELDIDEALKLYEHGQQLITELEAYLKTAEVKVTKLKAKFSE